MRRDRLSRAAGKLWHFLQALWEQVLQDNILIRAAGLAYATLLAMVPLVAVLFALFSAFGALEDLKQKVEELFFSQFLPTRQDELLSYLNEFTANANRLGFVGFLFLIVAAILLLDGIETNFNEIWRARGRRRILAKVTAYTSVLVFGTVFLGASLSLSARIKASLFANGLLDRGFFERLSGWLLPLLLTLLGFLLLYQIVPFARVRLRSALIGALAGGVIWEVAKNVFANTVGTSVRYSAIYGSLAAFPIFLVWLYVTWLIVLLGLEVAYTHQHFPSLERSLLRRGRPEESRLAQVLKIFLLIADRFDRRQKPPTVDEISERLDLPIERVQTLVEQLEDEALLRAAGEEGGERRLAPATSLDRIRISEVLGLFLDPGRSPGDEVIERTAARVLDELRQAGAEVLGETTVAQLLQRER